MVFSCKSGECFYIDNFVTHTSTVEVKLKGKQWGKNHGIILQECKPSSRCHLNNKATAQEICGGAQMSCKKNPFMFIISFFFFFLVSVHTVSKFSFVGIFDNISCSVYCFNMSRAHRVIYFIYEQKFKYPFNFPRMMFILIFFFISGLFNHYSLKNKDSIYNFTKYKSTIVLQNNDALYRSFLLNSMFARSICLLIIIYLAKK